VKRLKFYPAEKIDIDLEAAETVRALADYEGDQGDLSHGIELYEKLLKEIQPLEPDPEFNLEDAVHLSTICSAAAAFDRRARKDEQASALEARRMELWRRWERKLPNNPFVQQQLAAK
jgi:hypothetical protein